MLLTCVVINCMTNKGMTNRRMPLMSLTCVVINCMTNKGMTNGRMPLTSLGESVYCSLATLGTVHPASKYPKR